MFSTKFLSFADEHRATPVQDTAQRRHRRRRAVGTHSKDSFQIKTLRKPFLLSLVDNIPRFSLQPRRRLASWHVATSEFCAYLDTGGLLPRALFSPFSLRPNTLGSVRRREFGLICISSESCLWSNVGFARLLCFAALRSVISANAAPGELLRLCPGSARRAPQ